MPGGQVADLVAGAIAEHEHVLLGTRGHAQIAQRRLAHEDGAALQPLEIERVLLSARLPLEVRAALQGHALDRKSTRLNSSHRCISYAVFCLKKKRHTPPR